MGYEVIALPAAGFATLAVLAIAGCLRPAALDDGPDRSVGLGLADIAVAVFLMLLGSALTLSAIDYFGGMPTSDKPGAGGQEAPTPIQAWGALLGPVISLLPIAVYFAWRAAPVGWRVVGLWPTRPIRDLAVGVAGLVAATTMAMGLGTVVVMISQSLLGQPVPPVGHEMLDWLRRSDSPNQAAVLLTSALIVAPLLEETIFRGLIQSALGETLGRHRRWTVVMVAALAFTLVHTNVPWQVLPSLFVLGVVLGWVYERTGSLLPGVVVHAGFNAVNVGMVFLFQGPGG